MIRYKIVQVLNYKGQPWFHMVKKRSWYTLFLWHIVLHCHVLARAKECVRNHRYSSEVWTYEDGSGKIRKTDGPLRNDPSDEYYYKFNKIGK